jgi:hypothetical protein
MSLYLSERTGRIFDELWLDVIQATQHDGVSSKEFADLQTSQRRK